MTRDARLAILPMNTNATGTGIVPSQAISKGFYQTLETLFVWDSDIGALDAPCWMPGGSILIDAGVIFTRSIPREFDICPF